MYCSFVFVAKPFGANTYRKQQVKKNVGSFRTSLFVRPLLHCESGESGKQNLCRRGKRSLQCVLEELGTWMTDMVRLLGSNARIPWRQTAQVKQREREKVEPSVVYIQKQLLKEHLENILRQLYLVPHSFGVGMELSRRVSGRVTLSHPVLERFGLESALHISKPVFLLFITSLAVFKKWLSLEFLSLDNLEYLSPEECQLVARFQLNMAVKNSKFEETVFLRITLDSKGNITGWEERWSQRISDLLNAVKTENSFSTSSLNASRNSLRNISSHQQSLTGNGTKLGNVENLDVSLLQKNLLNLFLRKKTYIQSSEWYRSRVRKIISWSKEQYPKLFTSGVDLEDIYSEFVRLETPFVIAYGIPAVKQVHRSTHVLTKMLFKHVDCNFVSIVHPGPETVIAVYRVQGRGRFLGGKVQYLSRNILTIDLEGKIVRHKETWNVERNEIVKMWLSSNKMGY